MRIIATTALALSIGLAGCVSFLPTYDEALYKHATGVNEELDKVSAAVGAVYVPAPGFDKVEGFYVSAIAHLTEAERIAAGQRDFYRERIAGEPASRISEALANCRTAVLAQMDRHRRAPITPEFMSTLGTREACDIPTLMVNRLNRGGN